MWNRRDLKEQAKFHLRGKYWMAFVVTLILGILAGNGGGSGVGTSYNFSGIGNSNSYDGSVYDNGRFFLDSRLVEEINKFLASPWFQLVAAFVIAAVIFGIVYQIFVAGPIRVGAMRWFSRSRETAGTPSVSQMFSLFRRGRYLGSVSGMLWRGFWLWIWSTLSSLPIMASLLYFIFGNNIVTITRDNGGLMINFGFDSSSAGFISILTVILGVMISFALSILVVVKSYSYHLVPWILADNPAIGARRALNLSKDLTRGSKFEMFVLDLSFIGWYILGLLACCIGVIFVTPYYKATYTELYAALRDAGVDRGEVTMEELGYKRVQTAPIENNENLTNNSINEVNNDPEV